jgi:hypothetical protein
MIQSSYPATDRRGVDRSPGTKATGSINIAPSPWGREPSALWDNGKGACKSFAAGIAIMSGAQDGGTSLPWRSS